MGRSQHRRAGPLGDLDRRRGRPPRQTGLAGGLPWSTAALAVMWETQLSPGDVRALTGSQRAETRKDGLLHRARKTGQPGRGQSSARAPGSSWRHTSKSSGSRSWPTRRVQEPLRRPLPEERLRRRLPRGARGEFGPAERRQMLDFRRSGAVEAIVGEATPPNSRTRWRTPSSTSNALFKTYVPVQEATIVQVTEARRKGRQRLRGGNETG